jgi:hypothetical protein
MALRPQGGISPAPAKGKETHRWSSPAWAWAWVPTPLHPRTAQAWRPGGPTLACSWCSIPMLTVLTRMAIIMPRLKYLLSTMLLSLARVSRHTAPHSQAAPATCSSSSSFASSEEAPSSLLRGSSPSASASPKPEPEPSWPESVLPRPEDRRPASCWQCGQVVGSEASMAEMGCTSVWGVGSRGLCRGHSSEKQTLQHYCPHQAPAYPGRVPQGLPRTSQCCLGGGSNVS